MFDILYSPFWPSVLAVVTMIAAGFIGALDARKIKSGHPTQEWARRGLLIYFMPSLVFGYIIVSFVLHFHYNSSDFYELVNRVRSCPDKICKAALRDNYRLLYLGKLAIVEACLIGGMIGLLAIRTAFDRRSHIQRKGPPDPRKWHYQEETGEYHRITKFYKGHVYFSAKTYSDRLDDDRKASEELAKSAAKSISYFVLIFVLCATARAIAINFAGHPFDTTFIFCACLIFPGLVLILLLVSLFNMLRLLLSKLSDNLGPPPVAPGRQEDVDRRSIYG